MGDALLKFKIEGDVADWALMNEKTGRFVTEQVSSSIKFQAVQCTPW